MRHGDSLPLTQKRYPKSNIFIHKKKHYAFWYEPSAFLVKQKYVSSLFYYHLFAITFKNLFSAGTRLSRQSNPTVIVTMEAETQTEEEQVNIIEPSDPISPIDIVNFAPGTDSMLKLKTMKDS